MLRKKEKTAAAPAAKMPRKKSLLLGAACWLIGAILTTTTTTSSTFMNRRSVAFSGPVVAPELLWKVEAPLQMQMPKKGSDASGQQAGINWRQISSIKDNFANQHEQRPWPPPRIASRSIPIGSDDGPTEAMANVAELTRALRSVGLRKIQRQPGPLIEPAQTDGTTSFLSGGILERAVSRILQQQDENGEGSQDSSTMGAQFNKRSATREERQISLQQDSGDGAIGKDAGATKHEFIYVIAPISEQVLPFQSEKFAQGYKNFVSLAGPNYKIGLQKLTAPADVLVDVAGAAVDSNQATEANKNVLLLALGLEPDSSSSGGASESSESGLKLASLQQSSATLQSASTPGQPGDSSMLGCRPVRASVQISRDDYDMQSGQLVRQCTGLVSLNSCEGNCVSSVQPTIKSPSGFVKKCSCCNEGSFRRVQVRLNDCFLPPDVEPADKQLQSELAATTNGAVSSARKLDGYLDVIVNEPVDCKCRQCDSMI